MLKRWIWTQIIMLICWLRFIVWLYFCPDVGPWNPKLSLGPLGNLVAPIQPSCKERKFDSWLACMSNNLTIYIIYCTWPTLKCCAPMASWWDRSKLFIKGTKDMYLCSQPWICLQLKTIMSRANWQYAVSQRFRNCTIKPVSTWH